MANLDNLATEILLMIANLCHFAEHAALAGTCRSIYYAVNENLYEEGAKDVNTNPDEETNPAVYCIWQNNLPAMEKFIEYGMKVEAFVARCSDMHDIRISWMTYAMISNPIYYDFSDHSQSGTDMMQLLFRHGAKASSSLPVDGLNIDFGCDYEEEEWENMGRQPLHYAAYHGHILEHSDQPSEHIMRARILLLVKQGASIDCADGHSYTPLHCAASMDNLVVLKILLELGANANATMDILGTPLDNARFRGASLTAQAMIIEAGGISYGPPLSNTIEFYGR
jgi:ankyrin repeat protein